jgi:hypothetical protein
MGVKLRDRNGRMWTSRRIVATAVMVAGMLGSLSGAALAEDRQVQFGREIYKTKATCLFCHKWDGSGDQGYGGNALSLRKTELTREQLIEVVQCGRPATGMPYHDRFAYTDKRCFDMTRAELGKDTPPIGNEYLSKREIEAVVDFLLAVMVGKGDATHEECTTFFGEPTRQCDVLKVQR